MPEEEERCICQICECGVRKIRPAEALINSGEFNGETTNKADFYEKHAAKQVAFRPTETTIGGGEFLGNTTNKTDFDLKKSERQTPFRPAETAIGGGEFTGSTTTKTDFNMKRAERPTAFRPAETAIGGGEFSESTTSKVDFDRKEAERQKAFRPPVSKISSGDFDGITTTKADFDRKQGERIKAYRPPVTSLASGDFSGTTTNRADFVGKMQPKMDESALDDLENSFKRLLDESDEETTENGSIFNDALVLLLADKELNSRSNERLSVSDGVRAIRPKSNSLERGLPFEGHSTYQDGFFLKEAVRQRSMRPTETNYLSSSAFVGDTTQKSDFTAKKVDICPAEKVLSRRDKSYEFSAKRNGHDFYHHRITHSNRVHSSLVPVA
ncbi:hypothetical protein RB195_007991 [Necator americanus]|uniref:Uncharacterized protein n=1 Tax=Necator americanus TaxID=51031 RepID=A0ABR1BZX2_NECAM